MKKSLGLVLTVLLTAAAPLSQIFKLPVLAVPPEMLSVPVPTAAELDPPTKMPPVTL